MKAFRLTVLSVLLVILLVAPGYAGTTYYRSGSYGSVASYSDTHGTYMPVHERYYTHNGDRWDHRGYWGDDHYRPYGYYYRPYVYDYGYYRPYRPYYYGPYVHFSPAPGFSIDLGF